MLSPSDNLSSSRFDISFHSVEFPNQRYCFFAIYSLILVQNTFSIFRSVKGYKYPVVRENVFGSSKPVMEEKGRSKEFCCKRSRVFLLKHIFKIFLWLLPGNQPESHVIAL